MKSTNDMQSLVLAYKIVTMVNEMDRSIGLERTLTEGKNYNSLRGDFEVNSNLFTNMMKTLISKWNDFFLFNRKRNDKSIDILKLYDYLPKDIEGFKALHAEITKDYLTFMDRHKNITTTIDQINKRTEAACQLVLLSKIVVKRVHGNEKPTDQPIAKKPKNN